MEHEINESTKSSEPSQIINIDQSLFYTSCTYNPWLHNTENNHKSTSENIASNTIIYKGMEHEINY